MRKTWQYINVEKIQRPIKLTQTKLIYFSRKRKLYLCFLQCFISIFGPQARQIPHRNGAKKKGISPPFPRISTAVRGPKDGYTWHHRGVSLDGKEGSKHPSVFLGERGLHTARERALINWFIPEGRGKGGFWYQDGEGEKDMLVPNKGRFIKQISTEITLQKLHKILYIDQNFYTYVVVYSHVKVAYQINVHQYRWKPANCQHYSYFR